MVLSLFPNVGIQASRLSATARRRSRADRHHTVVVASCVDLARRAPLLVRGLRPPDVGLHCLPL